jgi:hypothetical protein
MEALVEKLARYTQKELGLFKISTVPVWDLFVDITHVWQSLHCDRLPVTEHLLDTERQVPSLSLIDVAQTTEDLYEVGAQNIQDCCFVTE